MLLDEVADLGAQANMTVMSVEDHSWQLGELLVMMQMVQEMMGAQQVQLMRLQEELCSWEDRLVAQETTVNDHLIYLWTQLEAMDVDAEGKEDEGDEEDEATTLTEVDKGSPVILDSDLDNFRSPELAPTLVYHGSMGGQPN